MSRAVEPARKKTIDEFQILEEMGQGAYGQVKLARHRATGRKVVLKYVTKRRILVDTWTRDRRLGTVPLEIHVLDYLRRPELRHPNIMEMEAFFEDDTNYYIEMVPHGLPGMDLFDYIELRASMDEAECRSIFLQVVRAVHHLHTKALVVHRDIEDENVILDGEGNIKLIDFGSAAYIKSGPFQVFVGTIGESPFPFSHSSPPPFFPTPLHFTQEPQGYILTRTKTTPPPRSSPESPTTARSRTSGRWASSPLHHHLQGKPLLQHRRDHGPRPARALRHVRGEHRPRAVHAREGRREEVFHRGGVGASLVCGGGGGSGVSWLGLWVLYRVVGWMGVFGLFL